MSSAYNITVEGYCFCRFDGQPFDTSITPFIPPQIHTTEQPQAKLDKMITCNVGEEAEPDFYHICSSPSLGGELVTPACSKPFLLAYRCNPAWDNLSEQQKDVVGCIEKEVDRCRKDGIFFRSVILEGMGGCGKTRLMAYIMNHSPENTHVFYVTKQNKRLQDFVYGDLHGGEVIPPKQPVTDISWTRSSGDVGGRYASSVEKLVYSASGSATSARETNSREALQWKMEIPDNLFTDNRVQTHPSNVVIILDEYTMIQPPLLHKMLHCFERLFAAPTLLIMGGDRFQLGPIRWNAHTDRIYKGRCGQEAPPSAVTRNNEYYGSDVREELKKRTNLKPFEYTMVGSQRCREDPRLAETIVYLRNACRRGASKKSIERRLVMGFSRLRDVPVFRYDAWGRKMGRVTFMDDDDVAVSLNDDHDDEDRHLGDDDLRDSLNIDVDWSNPPTVNMSTFIEFYCGLYEEIYLELVTALDGRTDDARISTTVYEKAYSFVNKAFPVFLVKKNTTCNILSDTFLKTLYSGVVTELTRKYEKENLSSQPDLSSDTVSSSVMCIRRFLENMCVSMTVSPVTPVQQTLMVGLPYRMTETLATDSTSIKNGELVLMTAIHFNSDRSISCIALKSIKRTSDQLLCVSPGLTSNRLNKSSDDYAKCNTSDVVDTTTTTTYMMPVVPMICENIYQMQGNTISSECFVDLSLTKRDDVYVAISRFQKASSIKGIIMSS